ncbi:MAG: NTP transferase domain-containing protein [Deltaproteobacteria bacterium]|jgi:NDP-sugar pyrophosphorylase family protein|nr:NTP transferase domain-containing protein [Deltaproteobacteria bacterium]
MILAAGFGTRLRPLTCLRPKPLLTVLNKPVLARWLDVLAGLGVSRTVVNAHYLAPMLADFIDSARGGYPRMEIIVSLEDEILGTGGGLKQAARLLFPDDDDGGGDTGGGAGRDDDGRGRKSKPFYVVNGDIHTDLDLKDLASAHLSASPVATLALVDRPGKATVSVDADGVILGFRAGEKLPGETGRLCGAGVMILESRFLELLPVGFSDSVERLGQLSDLGRAVRGRFYPGVDWTDIGSPGDYYALQKTLARGRIVAENPGLLEGDVSGFVVAEAGARVAGGASVRDCVLLREADVKAGAVVGGAVVAGTVGSDVRLEGGVVADRSDAGA